MATHAAIGRSGLAAAAALLLAAGTAAAQSAPDLVAQWGLNEVSGPTAVDSAGGNDGTWVGSPGSTGSVPPQISSWSTRSLQVSRPGQNYVDTPNTAALENVQESSYSIMGWFNPDDTPPLDADAGDPNENEGLYSIINKRGHHEGLRYLNNNKFSMGKWVSDGGTIVWAGVSSGGTFPPAQWYHVAAVIDFAAETTTLYVNGVQEGVRTWPAYTTPYREYDQRPWRIGIANPEGGYNSWEAQAQGSIDDVRIYSRALSASEIAAIAAGSDSGAFAPGSTPPPSTTPPASSSSGSSSDGKGDACGCGSIAPPRGGRLMGLVALLGVLAAAWGRRGRHGLRNI